MKKFRKISFIILGIIVTACLMLFGLYSFKHPAPDYSATIQIPGIQKATVHWDEEGIPHIDAQNIHDAYKVLGYVMAQERLFQMDIYRRAASGTLSELLGTPGVAIDKRARLIKFKKVFAQKKARGELDQATLNMLDAFYSGVNYFVENEKIPWEYSLLGSKPEKFDPLDAYAFIGLMSFQFSSAPKRDLLFSKMKSKLSPRMWHEFRHLERPSEAVGHLEIREFLDSTTSAINENYLDLDDILYFEGSNAWVISGEKTASGKPILASDPHIGFSLPGIWFEAQVTTPDFDIYGHFLPLMPFAVLGHNANHGWGVTISYVDDMDFFQEQINWDHQTFLNSQGEEVPLKVNNEIIKVKNKEDIPFTFYESSTGILLNGVTDVKYLSGYKDISLKWVWDDEQNDPIRSLYEVNNAQNFQDFIKPFEYVKAPGLNILYAHKDGKIAKFVVGGIPKRKETVDSSIILDATNSQHTWEGLYPFEQSRMLMQNPEHDIIISANDKSANYPQWFRGYWQPQDRFQAILRDLKKSNTWNIDQMRAVQTNSISSSAKELSSLLLQKLQNVSQFEKEMKILKNWDGQFHQDSPAAMLYSLWMQNISLAVFKPYLEEKEYFQFTEIAHNWNFLKALVKGDISSNWLDLSETPKDEIPFEFYATTLKRASLALEKKYGKDPSSWKWGNEHTLTFKHPFSKAPFIGKYLQLGPFPVVGGYNITNNFRRVGDHDGFKVTAGPSTRRLIDFRNPENSWGILPIGNSGNPRSEYFANQLDRFLNSVYRPQILKPFQKSLGPNIQTFIPRQSDR